MVDMSYKFNRTVEDARNHWGEEFDSMYMTIEDFQACCEDGGFIDYDGTGSWVVDDQLVDMFDEIYGAAMPSKVLTGQIPEGVTHVVWYNK
jgi:hypothetical protein